MALEHWPWNNFSSRLRRITGAKTLLNYTQTAISFRDRSQQLSGESERKEGRNNFVPTRFGGCVNYCNSCVIHFAILMGFRRLRRCSALVCRFVLLPSSSTLLNKANLSPELYCSNSKAPCSISFLAPTHHQICTSPKQTGRKPLTDEATAQMSTPRRECSVWCWIENKPSGKCAAV